MLLHQFCLWSVFTIRLALAQTSSIDLNRYPPLPQETACGDIVNANLNDQQYFFTAAEAFDCLTSVPFYPAVALRFLRHLNSTLQYHATTAFVRHPPPGYQQPAFDLFGALQDVVDRVDLGAYHNQYAFETAVQGLVRDLHDSHVYISGGINGVMSFFSPFRLASVSSNGQDPPQLYVYDDLIEQVNNNGPTASVITQINGIDAIEYVSSFATKQSFGMLEPNADWNQIMTTPAQELFGLNSFSEAAPLYGGDQLVLTFKNGTTVKGPWLALFGSPGFTGPLATGGDFYNFFVLGNYPANYDETYDAYYNNSTPDIPTYNAGDDDNGEDHASWNFESAAFPAETLVFQQDLGIFSDGALTGYYLDDVSTAVLSLPSFEQYGNDIDEFGQAVNQFVDRAIQRNAQKIIIDLQQNSGGLSALAFYVFDKFFPDTRPFAGSRMRSHRDANILGNTFTSSFETLTPDTDEYTVQYYQSSEWVVTDRINALTSTNFTSWDQYAGPLSYRGDNFTLVQQYDLSNPNFVEAALGVSWSPSCIYSETCGGSPPWSSANIVILTDGICGSTCSLFVEMMREQGVKTVTVGGRAEQGPMQAASGTRGAVPYSNDELYFDYTNAIEINATAAAILLPINPPDTGFAGVSIGFTLRDQIQRNQTVPNQVLYLPSDCRLYWTFDNFYNYTRLWQDVSTAMFTDSSLCVAGSLNAVAPPSPNATSTTGTGRGISTYITDGLIYDPLKNGSVWAGMDFSGILDITGGYVPYPQSCDFNNPTRQCGQLSFQCQKSTFPCATCGTTDVCTSPKVLGICSGYCFNSDSGPCPGNSRCAKPRPIPGRHNLVGRTDKQTRGICEPRWTSSGSSRSCSSITSTDLGKIINKRK